MIKILFICHGNICRSPMAEFVMKYLVKSKNLEEHFLIDSKATSTEEIGNPVHRGTTQKLREENIPLYPHYASQMEKSDYEKYDLIIYMDRMNYRNILRITGNDRENKIHSLLEYCGFDREVSDPWYTHNFDQTFEDIMKGCKALLDYLSSHGQF